MWVGLPRGSAPPQRALSPPPPLACLPPVVAAASRAGASILVFWSLHPGFFKFPDPKQERSCGEALTVGLAQGEEKERIVPYRRLLISSLPDSPPPLIEFLLALRASRE